MAGIIVQKMFIANRVPSQHVIREPQRGEALSITTENVNFRTALYFTSNAGYSTQSPERRHEPSSRNRHGALK